MALQQVIKLTKRMCVKGTTIVLFFILDQQGIHYQAFFITNTLPKAIVSSFRLHHEFSRRISDITFLIAWIAFAPSSSPSYVNLFVSLWLKFHQGY